LLELPDVAFYVVKVPLTCPLVRRLHQRSADTLPSPITPHGQYIDHREAAWTQNRFLRRELCPDREEADEFRPLFCNEHG
jgi:hypothetical protein